MRVDKTEPMVKFKSSSLLYDVELASNAGGKKMIEQTAIVVSVEAGYAWIIPEKLSEGCGQCATKGNCSTSSVLDVAQPKNAAKMRVLNPLYARPGDTVVVGMQGEALLVYSLLAYLLPLVSLLVFAALGGEIAGLMHVSPGAGAIIGGLGGLVGGLKFANMLGSSSFKSTDFHPVILRIKGQPLFALPTV